MLCYKKKIPENLIVRDYEDKEKSSRYDVMPGNTIKRRNQTFLRTLSLRRLSKYINTTLKSNETQGNFRESIYNPNALFEKSEDENEPDNAASAVFYCHGKQFILIKVSCYIFKKNNKIRMFCVWATEYFIFKLAIIVMIVLQSIFYAFYDYLDKNSESTMNRLVDILEPIFLSLYAIEFIMKVIARGFYSKNNTYLRKVINFIDLFVVISGIFSYMDFFRHFSILRLFRILSVLSKSPYFKSLKMLSKIIKTTMWHLVTIIAFLCIFLIIFAVIGLNLYKGDLNYRCRLTSEPLNGYWPLNTNETRICGGMFSCRANETCGSNFNYMSTNTSYVTGDFYKDNEIPQLNFGVTNFDNILYALVPTCQIYMIESFQEIMYLLFDATNPVVPAVYCIFLIIICSFFISNMAIAALVDSFSKESEKNRASGIIKNHDFDSAPPLPKEPSMGIIGYLTSFYQKTRSFLKQKTLKRAEGLDKMQAIAWFFVHNPMVQLTINLLVIGNMVILSLDSYPAPSSSEQLAYFYINMVFTILFFFECLLKMKLLGFEKYKKDKFNLLELAVAIATTFELIIGANNTKFASLRAFRLLRIFASHHSWDGFQILIDSLLESLNYVVGFVIIIGIYIYVLAIIGKKFFAVQMDLGNQIEYIKQTDGALRGNFENTLWAYTTVFQIICLEKWNEVWYKYNKLAGPTITNFYFITIIISGRFMIFNLFLAALLGLFEESRANIQFKKMKALFVLRTFRSPDKISPTTSKNKPFKEDTNGTLRLSSLKKSFKRTSTVNFPKKEIEKIDRSSIRRSSYKASLDSGEQIIHSEPEKNEEDDEKQLPDSQKINKTSINIVKKDSLEESVDISTKKRKKAIVALTDEKNEEKLQTNERLITSYSKKNKVHVEPLSLSQSNKSRASIAPQNKIKNSFTIKAQKSFIDHGYLFFSYMKESSCCIFHRKSKLRIKITALISNDSWDSFIMLLILVNSLFLALDNPLSDPNSEFSQALDILDYIFTSIFALEMFLKIISLGFLFNHTDNKKAYIRNVWNQLDCTVVLASLISWAVASNSGLKSLKSLRALRALRSLRMITKNESLRIVVNAIFQTIPSIGNLAIVAGVIDLVVSINTMNAWKGSFYFCSLPEEKISLYSQIKNKEDCLLNSGEWLNKRRNFDNIFNASLSFFLIIVNEDWLPLMYSSIDAVGIDQQPIVNWNVYVVFVYYILVIIGNVILMNLFASVVIDNFKQMKEELGGYLLLSKDQRDWVEMQKFMIRKKLKIKISKPENKWRAYCYQLINHSYFETFCLICIFLNVIIMSFRFITMSTQMDLVLGIINEFFLILFNIELFLRLFATGLLFFKDIWNKFDFLVILAADALVLALIIIGKQEITTLPLLIRVMRLSRIVKVIKISKTFQVIINTYYNILSSLGNIGALIFLLLYIYAILGMNLFSTIQINPYIGGIQPQWIPDFTQFSGALLTIIQCAMLQKWDHYMFELAEVKEGCSYSQTYNEIMADGIKGCGTPWSYLYFLSFVIIVPLMVMNLFLAVVVEGYLESIKEQDAVINPNQLEELLDKWAEYDPEGSGFMSPENMAFLLYELHPPIGLKDDSVQFEYDILAKKNKGYLVSPNKKVILTKNQIFNLMKFYNLRLYNDNKLHFKDLCVKISKNAIMRNSMKKDPHRHETIKLENLEIKSDYVVKSLNKQWDSVYPDLKKQRTEAIKNNRHDLRASDLFAIHSIMTLLRKAKAEKKNKPTTNELDFRVYHEYQQTNIMDKNLSTKVLRAQTILSQNPNYKKRASRYSSPYKSRQTMISAEKTPSNNNLIYLKKATHPSKFGDKLSDSSKGNLVSFGELRKTSTFDPKILFSEPKAEDRKKRKHRESSVNFNKMMNRLNEDKLEKGRLKSVMEIDEDEKLFWYSYEENLRQYPVKVKEDIQTMKVIKIKPLEIKKQESNEKKERKSFSEKEDEEEEEKSSATEDYENESDSKSKYQSNLSSNRRLKSEKMQSEENKIDATPQNTQDQTFKVKIMPLKLLKSKR